MAPKGLSKQSEKIMRSLEPSAPLYTLCEVKDKEGMKRGKQDRQPEGIYLLPDSVLSPLRENRTKATKFNSQPPANKHTDVCFYTAHSIERIVPMTGEGKQWKRGSPYTRLVHPTRDPEKKVQRCRKNKSPLSSHQPSFALQLQARSLVKDASCVSYDGVLLSPWLSDFWGYRDSRKKPM